MTTVFVSHPTDKLQSYFGDKAIAALQAIAQVRFNTEARDLLAHELVAAAQDCDAVIAYRQTAGSDVVFEGLPRLAVFLRCAVDTSTIDMAAANTHGVLVTRASAGFVPAVAEWVIAAMIDLGRGISHCAEAYHRGTAAAPVVGRQLRGSTLGVIGHGQIGQYLCQLALAMGMRVLVATPESVDEREGLRQLPLPTLLAQADFVVCLAAATPENHAMMNAAAFAAMQPGAFFLNAARGELVDDVALLAALDSGRLAGCALDVGRAPDQMPALALARHPLVVATPHIGGLTVPATEHQAMETVAQLKALQRGEWPAGAVNAEQATRLRRWPAFAGRQA